MATLDHKGNQNLPGTLKQAQLIAGTNTNVQSAAFSDHTHCVVIWSDASCFICINSNPTASTTVGTDSGNISSKIIANAYKPYAVLPGQKLAVITSGGAANVTIEEY